jgi:hypothetical protein
MKVTIQYLIAEFCYHIFSFEDKKIVEPHFNTVAEAEACAKEKGWEVVECQKVRIEEFDDTYSIVEESGQTIEPDFETHEEAETWAIDNNYTLVDTFFI